MGNTVDPTKDKINAAIATGQGVVDSKNRPPIPPPSQVISLRIYPIKSCRGIEIDSTRLKKSGLTLDRNWMFVNKADKKFLTIRGDPSMTLIDTNIIEGKDEFKGQQMLEISIHGRDSRVVVPAFPTQTWLQKNTTLETVNIWDQDTDGYLYSDEINSIFTDFFSKPVALVYKGPTSRMVAINGRKELYGQETPHHFADVMSLQIASEASLKDLNKRLHLPSETEDALTIERFRPNIIIRGRDSHPWEEDTWKRIRINTSIPAEEALYKIDLDVVARCARCQVPNVNPETAEKNPTQPWDTLMEFRRVDEGGPAKWKPCFGMMCLPKSEGKIAVGAELEVLETTDRHLYNVRAFEEL
ncbi:uncharacterized protein MYCFIDRAFT_211257 [Pseudocercospora fijiensis CIRAD86]|uniref:MOSC domain-containing protein n=1 Tax=Pseudocercospora fijiensis (strain CIRAD86) TaxID=383855 RepID=M3B155_PSEFD|nr:uncharacterized protein MYCFIDRAFT_211257 [Pseudocercospora fijiensis CIRAD86]EME83152.1 hypothetical protein MYCFIDRAFT_211257 [Pseudocercospora fijiensis CIRAD86]